MPINWNTINNERLIEAITTIEDPGELRRLLEDLLTEKELRMCAEKLNAAFLLKIGTPYDAVHQITGLSSATIAHISKLMINKKGGYQEAMKRLYPHGYRYSE